MNQIISEWRATVEFLYFLSGIVLSFGVIIAAAQIYLMRLDRISRIQKAESERAIDYSSRYLNNFIIIHNNLTKYLKLKNIELDWSEEFNNLPNHRKIEMLTTTLNDMEYMTQINMCLNELEAISSAFTSGVADKDIGFNIIGRTYVNTVSKYKSLLDIFGTNVNNRYYSSIFNLHADWSTRIRKGDIKSNIYKLQSKLQSIGK